MTNLWRGLGRGLALLWLGGIAAPLMPTAAAADPAVPAPAGRIDLVASSAIIGRMLRDPQGVPAGIVRKIVIDAGTGDVVFAVIGSGASVDLGDGLVAVPWSALRVSGDAQKPVDVAVPAARIAGAPRLDRADAYDSISTAAAAQARQWFGAPKRKPAGELVPVNRMLGALVYAPDSSEMIGDVDQVMLDLQHAHVAYDIVSRDAGLRVWKPVPFAALAWAPDLDDFIYRTDPAALDRAPALTMEPTATETSAAKLGTLYGQFGIKPYWTQSG